MWACTLAIATSGLQMSSWRTTTCSSSSSSKEWGPRTGNTIVTSVSFCFINLDDTALFVATRKETKLLLVGADMQINKTSLSSCFPRQYFYNLRKPGGLCPRTAITALCVSKRLVARSHFLLLLFSISYKNMATRMAWDFTVFELFLNVSYFWSQYQCQDVAVDVEEQGLFVKGRK